MEASLLLMQQVASMLLMAAVGIFVAKAGLITEEQSVGISNLTVFVFGPCMIFNALQMDFSFSKLLGLGLSILCALGTHLLFILLSKIFLLRGENLPLERVLTIFSNCGNLSFPILSATLGPESLFYASGYLLVFNFLFWTFGLIQISGDLSRLSWKKLLTNTNLLAIVAGLLFFFLPLELPKVVKLCFSSFGAMVAPASLLVLGFELSKMHIKTLLCQLRTYWVTFLRLLLFPLILLLLLQLIGFASWTPDSRMIALATVIIASAPSAASIPMLAQIFHLDAEYGARTVAITTLLSVLTMPLLTAIATYLL